MRELHNVLWNLFLAIVPVVLAIGVSRGIRLERHSEKPVRWTVWAPLLIVWLLFLPNTCYLLTEWRHYIEFIIDRPWLIRGARYDPAALTDFLILSGFYLFYTLCGLLNFFLAIWPLAKLLKPAWWLQTVIYLLCSLGVYLGLVKRLNSWQGVTDPAKVLHLIAHALQNPASDALIAGFAVVLWLAYSVMDLAVDGYRRRLEERKAA